MKCQIWLGSAKQHSHRLALTAHQHILGEENLSGAKIKVDCPKCLATLNVPADRGGLRVVCPKCKRSLLVPNAQTAANSVFDDLFESPLDPDPTPSTHEEAASNTNDLFETHTEKPAEPATKPATPKPTAPADNSANSDAPPPLAASSFDDIDNALQEFESSDQTIPSPAKPKPPKPKTPELPPVETINEEIELKESKPAPLPEIRLEPKAELQDPLSVSQPTGNADPNLEDLALPEGGLPIAEEFSLDEHLAIPDLDLPDVPSNDADPFLEDPNASINIDGLTPTIKSEDIYGVKCRVCDTRIHVNVDQNGSTIECPMCFSNVIIKLKKKDGKTAPKPRSQEGTMEIAPIEIAPEPDAGELSLAPVTSKPKPAKKKKKPVLDEETLKLAPIVPEEEPDEVDLEPISDLPDYDPANLKTEELDQLPDSQGDEPFQLAPLEETAPKANELSFSPDLLAPKPRPKSEEPNESIAEQEPKPTTTMDELFDEVDANAATLKSTAEERKKKNKDKEAEFGTKDYWEKQVNEVEPENDETPDIIKSDVLMPQHVLVWLSKNFASPEVLVRTVVAIVLLAISYVMFDIFHNTMTSEEATQTQKMLGTILPAIFGGLMFIPGLLVWLTTSGMVFDNSVNGVAQAEEWPGFSPGDWFGPLTFFLFSFILGSIPGVMAGALIAFFLEQNTWIIALGSATAFAIAPMLYCSAAFNGSAFNVISTKVTKTVGTEDINWLYYVPYVFAIWLMFFAGTMSLLLPTFVFSFVGAAIQVFALICFASVAGIHAARVVHRLQKK
jgi:DNA-directed RNA polymerase subunit RPC12/RpoP